MKWYRVRVEYDYLPTSRSRKKMTAFYEDRSIKADSYEDALKIARSLFLAKLRYVVERS